MHIPANDAAQRGRREVLPLTAEQRRAVTAAGISWRVYLAFAPVATALGALPSLLPEGGSISIPVLVGGVAAFNVAWFAAVVWRRVVASRRLSSSTFCRWTGPMLLYPKSIRRADGSSDVVFELMAGNVRLPLAGNRGHNLARHNLAHGSVDYATHSHEVLEVRDVDGTVLDRDPRLARAMSTGSRLAVRRWMLRA